jgi:hypothetical protein
MASAASPVCDLPCCLLCVVDLFWFALPYIIGRQFAWSEDKMGSGASADNSRWSAADAAAASLVSVEKQPERRHLCFAARRAFAGQRAFADPKSPDAPEPFFFASRLSTVISEEWAWARGVARRGSSVVALLAHLKMFQHVGRFLSVADLPSAVISHVAMQIHLEVPSDLGYDRRTLYRHHQAIRQYLGITPWGAKARGIASTAIAAAADARIDPADLINAFEG